MEWNALETFDGTSQYWIMHCINVTLQKQPDPVEKLARTNGKQNGSASTLQRVLQT